MLLACCQLSAQHIIEVAMSGVFNPLALSAIPTVVIQQLAANWYLCSCRCQMHLFLILLGALSTCISSLKGITCITYRSVYCRLPWNRCGCVYQLEVDADFVATQMYSLICGNNVTNTDIDNKCDINSIAAPDNLSMMRGHNQMIIGEDTEDHQNDVVWLYNFDVSLDFMLKASAWLA